MNKKGFSLIELLAVVIILAILALITIPIVGNLIKQARINAAVVSAYGYVEATNNEVVSKQTRGEMVASTQYEIEDFKVVGNLLETKYEGRGPEKGWFVLEREKVKNGEFCINGYEVHYNNGKATYVPNGDYCAPPPRPTVCRINDGYLDYSEITEIEVAKVEDLVCLSDLVNAGYSFEGKIVTLTNNIDFNDDKSYNDPNGILGNHTTPIKTEVTTGSGFTPIGNDSKQFKGTFTSSDFNTISNLYINRSTSNYVGLFGCITTPAKIEGFKLLNANVRGYMYVGGILGYHIKGEVKSISIDDSNITGQTYVGGLTGYMREGKVEEIAVRSNITSISDTVGAVLGYVGNSSTPAVVSDLFSSSNVTGTSAVGGLIGSSYSTSKVKGIVEGGIITATGTGSYSGLAGKATGDGSYQGMIYTSNKIEINRARSEYWSRNVLHKGYDGNNYDMDTYHYIGMYDDIIDTIYGGATGNYYFDYENNKLVLKCITSSPITTTIKGSGTESSPYILETEKDFRDAAILSKGTYYFKIAKDLDISTFTRFYQLGTANNYFNGYLDGNSKTITKMYLNGGKNAGFIGNINGGSVSNLKITDSKLKYGYGYATSAEDSLSGILIGQGINVTVNNIEVDNIEIDKRVGSTYIGTLVGDSTGTFNNIKVTNMNTKGYNGTGGVIGRLGSSSSMSNLYVDLSNKIIVGSGSITGGIAATVNSPITFSYINADGLTVNGQQYTGGLYGEQAEANTIGGFDVNNITVTGTLYLGGIVGKKYGTVSSMNIEGVSVTGTSYIGGVVGHEFGVTEEISLRGTITGTSTYVGGIAGAANYDSNIQIKGVLVNANITGQSSVGGITGASHSLNIIKGVVERANIEATGTEATSGLAGKATGEGSYQGMIYTSNNIVITRARSDYWNRNTQHKAYDGNYYDMTNYHYMGMYDDVLDTIYGGATGSFYFDYDSTTPNKLVVKNITTSPITTTITGSGTESSPYILASESDFRDAAILSKGSYYFKINNDIDVSSFTRFYQLGTNENFFNGKLDGNNKTISNMYLDGGLNAGFIGFTSGGKVENLKIIDSAIKYGYGYGNNVEIETDAKTGILIGVGSNVIVNNIEVNNIEVDKSNGSTFVGSLVGDSTGSFNNLKATSLTVKGVRGVGGLIGRLGSSSSMSNVYFDFSNKTINAPGSYIGGVAGIVNSPITFTYINLDNLNISNGNTYIGGVYGQQSAANTVGEFNIDNLTVDGRRYVGGVVGQSSGIINKMNLSNLTVTSTGEYVGGVTGYKGANTIEEMTIRGSITGDSRVGGVAGEAVNKNTILRSILVDANVSGKNMIGGYTGDTYETPKYYGIVEGGLITANGTDTRSGVAGKATSRIMNYSGLVYVSNSVEVSRVKTSYTSGNTSINAEDGTAYSSEYNGDLSYYGNIRYSLNNTTYPLLDSNVTGDIDATGWWFTYNSNYDIIVTRVSDYIATPSNPVVPPQPVCTENCSRNIINTESITGTCPEGITDTVKPTCEFKGMTPIKDGIMAQFSCTDDQGVPEVYSMFNSVVQTTYTAQEILDRQGTQKTGTVNGNTRNITSRWTTNYDGPKPERGLCYYYQIAVVDQCGNTNSYVTEYCERGFSNPE